MNRLALMVLKNLHRIPFLYGKLCKYAKNPEHYTEEEMYRHIQRILQLAAKAGNVTVEVHGRENIPAESGFIMYGNHQGMFDVMAVVADMHHPMSAVYKTELKDIPLIREIAACLKGLPMDRDDVRQSLEVIRTVTKEIQAGRNYIIYPEGTRSKNGNVMGDFHHGSFRCATTAKCPVLPVCVIDTHKVLDQKGSKPITVQMHYLKPIMPEEYKGMKTNQLADLVKSRIQECLDEYA
ncbi:MAG: 1-acyl-sn-glycerol-3-phosphate acyltransferase [Oscillospiraceae bacterium]|nr:1-acyl-sn-glycerol-3-phosphate acyltransferase [Oscillospiraceae bacterium]